MLSIAQPLGGGHIVICKRVWHLVRTFSNCSHRTASLVCDKGDSLRKGIFAAVLVAQWRWLKSPLRFRQPKRLPLSARKCAWAPFSGDSARMRERETLEDQGFVHVPCAIPLESAREMLDTLWEAYEDKYGVSRDDSKGWVTKKGMDVRLYGTPPRALVESHHYKMLVAKMQEQVDDMFGVGAWRVRGKATVFVNCPNPAKGWIVPSGWHTDVGVDPSYHGPPDFIYAFAFLDHLDPRGGATMLVAGSTQRLLKMTGAVPKGGVDLKELLVKKCDWFVDLFGPLDGCDLAGEQDDLIDLRSSDGEIARRLMDEGIVSDGVLLRVVELIGAPGDFILWDPRALHSASSNVASRPRSVLRLRIERADSPHYIQS